MLIHSVTFLNRGCQAEVIVPLTITWYYLLDLQSLACSILVFCLLLHCLSNISHLLGCLEPLRLNSSTSDIYVI